MRRFITVLSALFAGLVLMFLAQTGVAAQDGFGFGDEEESASGGGFLSGSPVSVGGEVSATLRGFVDDFRDGAASTRLGDVFAGRLNFSAETRAALAVINLKLSPAGQPAASVGAPDVPIAIDEAYLRAYFGPVTVEGGHRKLAWGKADMLGPLDVINPLDYSDLTLMVDMLDDTMAQKIARPLVRASVQIGMFSTLEAVFVPNFEPARLDTGGRWAPAELSALPQQIAGRIVAITNLAQKQHAALALSQQLPGFIDNAYPDTSTIDYAQGGLRFTATAGSSDFGVQYYHGRITEPAVSLAKTAASISAAAFDLMTAASETAVDTALASLLPPEIIYTPYHQIGFDYAQVIAGFNVRAELAVNITDDLAGDDGTVHNPYLGWSLGFDRDLFWGVNLNLQAVEKVILLHDKIGDDPMTEIEAGSDPTSTRLVARLSKTFFRDELEIAAAVLWEPEDKDCLIMPVVTWTRNDVTAELAGGFFAGDKTGRLGQYRDNSFVQMRLKYSF